MKSRGSEHNVPSLIYDLPSITNRLDLAKLFAPERSLEVELGSGDASFLVAYAAQHVDRDFVGVERLLGRLRKLDRKGRRVGLTNLYGVRMESSYFLEWLLPPGSVSALHVYFPDPWPKKKHRKYRLINEQFPSLAQRVLVPDGAVYLRTDDGDYHAQMRRVFATATGFREIETPDELAAFLTDFEREFNERGIATLRLAYRRG